MTDPDLKKNTMRQVSRGSFIGIRWDTQAASGREKKEGRVGGRETVTFIGPVAHAQRDTGLLGS